MLHASKQVENLPKGTELPPEGVAVALADYSSRKLGKDDNVEVTLVFKRPEPQSEIRVRQERVTVFVRVHDVFKAGADLQFETRTPISTAGPHSGQKSFDTSDVESVILHGPPVKFVSTVDEFKKSGAHCWARRTYDAEPPPAT